MLMGWQTHPESGCPLYTWDGKTIRNPDALYTHEMKALRNPDALCATRKPLDVNRNIDVCIASISKFFSQDLEPRRPSPTLPRFRHGNRAQGTRRHVPMPPYQDAVAIHLESRNNGRREQSKCRCRPTSRTHRLRTLCTHKPYPNPQVLNTRGSSNANRSRLVPICRIGSMAFCTLT